MFMNLIKNLTFLFIFISVLAIIKSCQEPDIKKESGDVKLKGITPIDPGNPIPLFSLYAIRNNTLYGVDHNTGSITAIGSKGFWTGATAITVVYLPCGLGQYTVQIMKGNALYNVNPQTGFTQKAGSALILGSTRFLFGYYMTRILTTSQLFYNLSCSLSPRMISGTLTNVKATATVSHVGDEEAPRVETNYFIRDGSLFSIEANAIVFAGPDDWSGATAMTSIGDQLYIVQLNAVYRFNTKTGERARVSLANADWSGTNALGAAEGLLYAIKDGTLYRIDPINGEATQIGAFGDWGGTAALVNLPPRRVFP